MWDDLFAELVEDGETGGNASQTRTDADGIVRSITYDTLPTGSLVGGAGWVEAAEEGITVVESKAQGGDNPDRKADKDKRGWKQLTGKRAAKFSARLNGVEDAPSKRKRGPKADTVDPSTNGVHTS